jgi:putative ATPase
MHLRNAPTAPMKEWGYGEGYEHAHNREEGLAAMECLPEWLRGRRFYIPTGRGVEERIRERLDAIRRWKEEQRGRNPATQD